MMQKTKFNAAILIIGNEILSGRTQDTNTGTIALWLNSIGVKVNEVRVIPDIESTIIDTVNILRKTSNYVFTTGGIGPTHDDITALSISKAFKTRYNFNKEAYSILEKYYSKEKFNDARQKMAKMPAGSKLIYNPSSGAPGFMIKNVLCLPGVPSILKSMMPNLKNYLIKGPLTYSKTISLITYESNIANILDKLQRKYTLSIEIGSYPFFRLGRVGVSVVLRSTNKDAIKKCEIELLKIVKKIKIKIYKA